MKYKHLFFDLDHTLWDFEANAKLTMEELFQSLKLKERGIDDFDRFYKNYLLLNEKLWEQYRKGTISQNDLRFKRMWLALLEFKIADEKLAMEMNSQFLDLLPSRTILFPYTKEILTYLQNKNYSLHLITNGFEKVQFCKLEHSGLTNFFKEVITSESSNSIKPKKEIFEFAFNKARALPKESIMLGDNIEVDILGAMNVGMDQVFINFEKIETSVKPTFTVNSLKELEAIF